MNQAPSKRDRNGGSRLLSTAYESDSDGSSCGQGGCLGGCISSLLGEDNRTPLSLTTPSSTTRAGGTGDDDPTLLVAKELNQLSLQEREIVYEDLHGVSMVEDESDLELVNSRLNDMQIQLEKIPRAKKTAYLVALEECGQKGKDICTDESLHKVFLRADRWDAQKAAARFVAWMKWKLELYGRDVLCKRHVTLDDLDKDGRAMVKSGRIQVLPKRDTSGRTVVLDFISQHSVRTVKSMLEMFWYILMASVEDDVQAQRLGIVYIIYYTGGSVTFNESDRKLFWETSRNAGALPVRVNSVHCCFDDPKIGTLIALMQRATASHLRVRFRSHQGTHTEAQYSLMTYGVPSDVLPITADGNLKLPNHSKWYKRRIIRDRALSDQGNVGSEGFQGIDLPGRYDVLLGKGAPIHESPGNRRLQELVRMHFQEFDDAAYGNKQLIAEKLVKMIQDPSSMTSLSVIGGSVTGNSNAVSAGAPRFLKRRDDGWWEPVSDVIAMDKVCHSFRALRESKVAPIARASFLTSPDSIKRIRSPNEK